MRPLPTTLAAATLLGVGGAAGAAVTATPERIIRSGRSQPGPVEVRTQVVTRTIHVVKHVRPKHPPAAAPPAPARTQLTASATRSVAGASAPLRTTSSATGHSTSTVRPLRSSSSATGGGTGTARPLRTSSSATGGGTSTARPLRTTSSATRGGEHEHEGGGGDG